MDNSCTNHNTTQQAKGTTQHASGTAGGQLAQLPISTPLNHCGGADLPLLNGTQNQAPVNFSLLQKSTSQAALGG
ncbi:chaplin family protein [Streptomyces netropsis]